MRALQLAMLAVGMAASHPVFADPGPVTVQHAWARATTPGVSAGGVYATLTSPDGDRLVGVSSPASAKADLHSMQMDGSIMRMREIAGGLVLPPGKPVTLSPAGNHIMLDGLKAPLKQGSVVPVRLVFAKAPPVDIQAQVQSTGSAGPAAMPGMSMSK